MEKSHVARLADLRAVAVQDDPRRPDLAGGRPGVRRLRDQPALAAEQRSRRRIAPARSRRRSRRSPSTRASAAPRSASSSSRSTTRRPPRPARMPAVTTRLYGIPNCDTVKRARAWFVARGLDVEFVDYKKTPPTRALIERWLARVDADALVNRSGTTWRKLERRRAGLRRRQPRRRDRADARPALPHPASRDRARRRPPRRLRRRPLRQDLPWVTPSNSRAR